MVSCKGTFVVWRGSEAKLAVFSVIFSLYLQSETLSIPISASIEIPSVLLPAWILHPSSYSCLQVRQPKFFLHVIFNLVDKAAQKLPVKQQQQKPIKIFLMHFHDTIFLLQNERYFNIIQFLDVGITQDRPYSHYSLTNYITESQNF